MNQSSGGFKKTAALGVLSLGVVFGDIGTSPLYALRESLAGEHGILVNRANVLGVLSLIFWSLIIVIMVKYLLIVMRADNDGEGGILALAALITGPANRNRRLVLLGLFGTALLYGDGMITPAISVLSAVEGLEVVAPSIHNLVAPIVVLILIALFMVQRFGTHRVGQVFGPVMLLWFLVLAVLGLASIAKEPSVLSALQPGHAVRFFVENGWKGFLVLGSVFLVVTGGEALYADMGHFGRKPIQFGWFAVALPALVINYLGQGALLLENPEAIANPFYLLAPQWARWPLTILATAAAVIASQALITGAFSLTVQAVNLGYLPRMRTVQTSAQHRGQVYVPAINWFLLIACVALVVGFDSASRLAAAYGIAVTLTMVITTLLIGWIARHRWGWSNLKTTLILGPLLVIDTAFASANMFKLPYGGWFPLVVGFAGFVIFTTWWSGRRLLRGRIDRTSISLDDFLENLAERQVHRQNGTAVYMHSRPGVVPPALRTNLRHYGTLHETIAVVSVLTDDRPHVPIEERSNVADRGLGIYEIEMHYGFTDPTTVSTDLTEVSIEDVDFDPRHATYFLGRERIEVRKRGGMATWREHLFAFMSRNASDPTAHFGISPEQAIDIGTHVDL